MSDAPERIWAFSADYIAEDEGGATIVAHEDVQRGAVEYVIADLLTAALAREAALREALEPLLKFAKRYSGGYTHDLRIGKAERALSVQP